ncbi:MAG: hypothetical protein KF753_15315 [Caldilineaceae bacterium]|nr:hypothetical protein [Caldilineaceae bacterium]
MDTNLIIRLIFLTSLIVTITDAVVFYRLKQNPQEITVRYVILVILVTIVPIGINIWYHGRIGR